jgi:hypothetical protein
MMHQHDAPLNLYEYGDFRGVWIEFKPNSTGRNVKCDRVTVSNSPEEEVYRGMFGQKEALYSADLETIAATLRLSPLKN